MRSNHVMSVVAAAGFVLAAAMAFGLSNDANRSGALTVANDSELLYPRSMIIAYDSGTTHGGHDGIARLDTQTGAIYRFNGSVTNSGSRAVWVLEVPGVDGHTSGVLEIQQPEGVTSRAAATFLVDIVTGDTWILRRRSDRAGWEPVEIHR